MTSKSTLGTAWQLPRLNNSNSLRRKSSFGVDSTVTTPDFHLAALNSISRSVKYNDPSFATTRPLEKLRKELPQPEDLQYESAHINLTDIRKKYDSMGKTLAAKQAESVVLQHERDEMAASKAFYEAQKEETCRKLQELKGKVQEAKTTALEKDFQKKTLQAMIDRYKQDSILYSLRKYTHEKELGYLQKQREAIIEESSGHDEAKDRGEKVCLKLKKEIDNERREREAHLNSVGYSLGVRVDLQERGVVRAAECVQVAEEAMQERNSQEKTWEKVYLCHRMVEKLLRSKMQGEMKKFQKVELAFKTIKTATGVNDTETLIKKFLSKEIVYGQLLGKIADNQRRILQLKTEADELAKDRKALKDEKSNFIQSKSSVGTQAEERALAVMIQRQSDTSLLETKLRNWLARTTRRFNAIAGGQSRSVIGPTREALAEKLKSTLGTLVQELERLSKVELSEVAVSEISEGGDRLMRIRVEGEEEQTVNQGEECDAINADRIDLLRGNEKFMKEVKKRREEARKVLIDSEPKRKDVVVVVEKPKPVIEEG